VLDHPAGSALLTTAGNPFSTAVGRTVLRVLRSEGLPEQAAERGRRLREGLRQATDAEDVVGDIRGRGLAIGVDLVTDRSSRQRDHALAARVAYRAWELGAVVHYVGGNVLEVTPPLVITEQEVDRAVDLLATAVRTAGRVTDAQLGPYAGW
jgi:4-aminobutyrate aminotransferase